MIDYGKVDDRPYIPTPYEVTLAQQSLRRDRISSGLGASPISSMVGNLAQSAFKSVTIRSQITPDYTYDPNAPAGPPSGFNEWVLKNLIRPQIIVQTPAGPVQLAPYGEPKVNLFPVLVLGTLAAAGVVGYYAWQGLVKAKKK